jgi:hypothetical protein
MDDKPFFEFNLLDFQDRHVDELKKFTKSTFQLEEILTTASELKYTAAIGRIVAREFEEPSENFVRFFATQVYSGRMTQQVREQFTDITKRALQRFMNDKINERLTSALKGASTLEKSPQQQEEEPPKEVEERDLKKDVTTTPEETEAYFAVKAMLRGAVDVKRVFMRDTKSYCGILLDDNNRQPICRLYFNREQRYLGVFDKDRSETKIPISEVDDIYQHADALIARARQYDGQG